MTGGYAATDHASMIADERRVAAYAAAMKAAIRPGCTVFEIGTGCGLFALHACALGAARVFAIEAEDSYFVARDVIKQSPHAGKIELAHGLSTHVTLPQRADVIISDLHGVLPMFGAHIESIADARARHLAEGGVLIPQDDTLWAAPVHCPSLYALPHRAYLSAPLGIDLSAATAARSSSSPTNLGSCKGSPLGSMGTSASGPNSAITPANLVSFTVARSSPSNSQCPSRWETA